MAVSRIVQASSSSAQPIGATGTYTLAAPLSPGLYRITTDTTQSFSTAQLYFQTAQGYRFGAAIRGGQGYVAIPLTVTSITFTSGTFPLLVGFELFSSYKLIDAPQVSDNDITFYPNLTGTNLMDLAFSLPAGAAGIGIYWTNGTFTDLSTTTSPKLNITLPSTPVSGAQYPFMVVAKDSNGVFGLGTATNKLYPFTVFNSSGTWTKPINVNTVRVAVVGAGGGGGGHSNFGTAPGGGGGGGGGVLINNSFPVNSDISVIVGSGGNGGEYATNGNAGGTTQFGNISSSGGTGGLFNGAGGTSGNGFAGSVKANSGSYGGGGGGASAAATDRFGAAGVSVFDQGCGGGGGGGLDTDIYSFTTSSGADGGGTGAANGIAATSGVRGGGGGGAHRYGNNRPPGGTGGSGIVIVEAL